MTRAAELERKINTAMRKQELCKGMAQRITPSLSSDRVSHTRNITASEDAISRLMEAETMAAKEHVTKDCVYKRHSRALDELETLLVP